jgi:hypothetical protein
MTKTQWEKQFDFDNLYLHCGSNHPDYYQTCGEDVKDFIRTLLAEQRQAVVQECIETTQDVSFAIALNAVIKAYLEALLTKPVERISKQTRPTGKPARDK